MASQPETRFKIKVLKEVRKIPKLWCFKVEAGAIAGTPDIIGCVNAHFFALELKTETGKLSQLQKHKIERIRKNGGYAEVVRPSNLKMVLSDLNQIAVGKALNHLYISP